MYDRYALFKSLVNEGELLKLYKKYQELDVTGRGLLTNKEFLDLPELRYTPFRSRLIDGFPLRTDENVRAMRVVRQDSLHLEDIWIMGGDDKRRNTGEAGRNEDDPNNATNFPDDKGKGPAGKGGKVAPES